MKTFPWAPDSFTNAPSVLRLLRDEPEEIRLQAGARRALALFHQASRRVPAYAQHLAHQGVKPASIKDIGDWPQVPRTDKADYLRRYRP